MKTLLPLHFAKIILLACTCALVLCLNVFLGELKASDRINWIDIFGEGATLGLMLMFLIFVLSSRPRGRVTNCLVAGLMGFCAATFQDVLDEVFAIEAGLVFDDFIESVITPFAVVALAYGLYLWNQEQQAINQRLQCKERFYREHSALDGVTDLYTALYMQKHIDRELQLFQKHQQPFCLMMIDLDHFDDFNRRYGQHDGDRLLAQVANLTVLNLRPEDLACRYAGDRFIVLFPQTQLVDAETYAREIHNALCNMAFKPNRAARSVYINCTYSLVDHSASSDASGLIAHLNKSLEQQKSQHKLSQLPAINRQAENAQQPAF